MQQFSTLESVRFFFPHNNFQRFHRLPLDMISFCSALSFVFKCWHNFLFFITSLFFFSFGMIQINVFIQQDIQQECANFQCDPYFSCSSFMVRCRIALTHSTSPQLSFSISISQGYSRTCFFFRT